MLLNILLLSILLLSIAMLGLAFNIIFRKKGKFPAYRVGHNPQMRKIGISCVKHDEIKCFKKSLKEIEEKDCAGCQQVAG